MSTAHSRKLLVPSFRSKYDTCRWIR